MEAAAAQGCANCVFLQAQVKELQATTVQLRRQVQELQSRLNQNSSNSHKPPSSNKPGNKPAAKKPSGGKPGGQIGHQGHYRHRLAAQRVNQIINHIPGTCQHCQAPLSYEAAAGDPPPSWHQVAELPPMAAVVTEHRGHARRCCCCGKVTRQPIPAQVLSHVIGPRLAAAMSYLAGRCHDGRRTVREVVQDLFDVPVALGTVMAYERQMSDALAPAHQQAKAAVTDCACRWVDETGWKQAGRGRWLWTAASKQVACFVIDSRRSHQALLDLVGRKSRGIVTSDRHSSYNRLPRRQRQLCWAHLKRDFVKWLEKGPDTRPLGAEGLKVCRNVFALWRDFRQAVISRRQLQRRAGPLRRRLSQILQWNLRSADIKAAEFCRRLARVQSALWTFVRHEQAEPTNNHAERMLRMAVLWRKNSFGSHSDPGCRFAERMLTTVQTLRLQGRCVIDFLHRTLQAHRNGTRLPALT
jgi:transposase